MMKKCHLKKKPTIKLVLTDFCAFSSAVAQVWRVTQILLLQERCFLLFKTAALHTAWKYLQINENPFNLLLICKLIHLSFLFSVPPHGSVWWRLQWRTASLFQKSSSDDGALPSAAGDAATLPKSRNRPVRKGRAKQDCPEQPNSATDAGVRSPLETLHNGKLSNLQELLLQPDKLLTLLQVRL